MRRRLYKATNTVLNFSILYYFTKSKIQTVHENKTNFVLKIIYQTC
jgi:hypothetical protein